MTVIFALLDRRVDTLSGPAVPEVGRQESSQAGVFDALAAGSSASPRGEPYFTGLFLGGLG
jgi:hypothetical protein